MRDFFEMLNPATNKRVKGAITIFLLILMTPFVTMAFAMLELGRYQNTVNKLDEAMGISTMSLLANYDKYLQDRFGLYACTQTKDLNDLYQIYLKENLETLRFTSDVNAVKGVSVTGVYSLAQSDVLRKQIDEYMALNGPYTLITETLNLNELLGCFDSIAFWESFAKTASDGIGIASDAETMAESADEVRELADKIVNTGVPDYDSSYSSFKGSVDAYITKASTPRPTDPPSNASDDDKKAVATQQAEYDKALATLEATVEAKKTEYANDIQELIYLLEDFKTAMGDYDKAASSMIEDTGSFASDAGDAFKNYRRQEIANLQEQLKDTSLTDAQRADLERQLQEAKVDAATEKIEGNFLSGYGAGVKKLKDIGMTYNSDDLDQSIKDLKALKNTIKNFDVTTVTTSLSDSTYHITASGYLNPDAVDSYFEEAAREVAEDAGLQFIKSLSAFFQKLIKFQLFYDPAQSAKVNKDYYADKFANYEYEDPSVIDIIDDIFAIIDACEDLVENVEDNFPSHPIKLIKDFFADLARVFEKIGKFITDLLAFIGIITARAAYVAQHPLSIMNACGYAAYNMSCRTGKPVLGTQSSKAMATVGPLQSLGTPLVGGISAFIDSLLGPASDYSFCGCEVEYILFGNYTEIGNQTLAFFAIYLLRLIVDAPAIACNAEVLEMAAAAAAGTFGIGEVAVWVIEILCEPLVDTVLLVNSMSVPLIKFTIYLTPSGIVDLIPKMVGWALTPDQKTQVTNDVYNALGTDASVRDTINNSRPSTASGGWEKWAEGMLNMTYRDHLFLLLVCTISDLQDPLEMYERIANVIVMEETQYMRTTKGDNSLYFDLNKAYTFVETSATVTFNPVLSGNNNYSSNDSKFFTINRAIYRGY